MNKNINELSTYSVDITYQDTDIAGVVYFANYLNYAEKGRSKLLKGIFGKTKFSETQNWAVRSTSISYFKPTLIDETLVVKTKIKELKKASLIFLHEMYVKDVMVASNEIHLLCIGSDLRPAKIEDKVYNELFSIYNTYGIN